MPWKGLMSLHELASTHAFVISGRLALLIIVARERKAILRDNLLHVEDVAYCRP